MSTRAVSRRAGALFVAFEGGEGSGKTTQARRLALRLSCEGHEVVLTREPGGTPFAERIRRLLLDETETGMCGKTELLLYLAARVEHVEKLIVPALEQGCVVICDRFSAASVAYQGAGRGLGQKQVEEWCAWATEALWPDLTFVFDIVPEAGLARNRKGGSPTDRLEREDVAFHNRVRDAYLAWAEAYPHRVVVLDGDRPEDEIEEDVWRGVTALMSAGE
jgi:dTMP kinase